VRLDEVGEREPGIIRIGTADEPLPVLLPSCNGVRAPRHPRFQGRVWHPKVVRRFRYRIAGQLFRIEKGTVAHATILYASFPAFQSTEVCGYVFTASAVPPPSAGAAGSSPRGRRGEGAQEADATHETDAADRLRAGRTHKRDSAGKLALALVVTAEQALPVFPASM